MSTTVAPLSPEVAAEFQALAAQLSPENLTADGELSPAAAERRRMNLLACWKGLERMVGRPVSETEIYRQAA